MNTSARMLRLLSLLQTHRYWPGGELSERLEVSPRTLRRDIDRLRALGCAVAAAGGRAGPGLPRRWAGRVRVHRARCDRHEPPGRAAPPGLRRPPLVPGRLRPG